MDNLCRTCGKSSKDALASIFLASRYTLKFADMIRECTSVNISFPDELPKLICIDCQNRLEISYSFKRQCLESEQKLKEIGLSSESFQHEYFNIKPVQLKREEVNTSDDYFDNNSYLSNDDNSVKSGVNSEFESTNYQTEEIHIKPVQTKFDEINFPTHNFDNNSDLSNDDNSVEVDDNVQIKNAKKSQKNEVIESLKCKYCDRTFTSDMYLKGHMTKTHHRPECARCCKPFDNEQIIIEHMKTHERDISPCTCYLCGKGFTAIGSLRRHLKTHHPNSVGIDRTLKCEECNVDFSTNEFFENHIQEKHSLRQFKCEYCDVCFESEKGFQIHNTLKHAKDNEIICERCLLSYDTADALIEHHKTHKYDLLPFKCQECGKDFDVKYKLKKHLWYHLGRNPERVCPICHKSFSHKYILIQHMRKSHPSLKSNEKPKPRKCTRCHKRFENEESLVEHLQSVHKQKTFACVQCTSSFHSQFLLNGHLAETHDFLCKRCLLKCYSQDKLEEHLKIHENDPANFICRHCGKGFDWGRDDLMRHLKIHEGEKLHICQYCGSSFNEKSNLTVHVRTHTGEKPFKCTVCDKTFHQWASLHLHKAVHDPEKKFKCEYCGLKLARKQSLRLHVQKHLGLIKKYKCNICGKSVPTSYRRKHERKHSGETPHICSICDRGFHRADTLRTHMKTHSGNKTDKQTD